MIFDRQLTKLWVLGGIIYIIMRERPKYLLREYINTSDGSSPKNTSPGQARALKVELELGPSLCPSEKVKPEP